MQQSWVHATNTLENAVDDEQILLEHNSSKKIIENSPALPKLFASSSEMIIDKKSHPNESLLEALILPCIHTESTKGPSLCEEDSFFVISPIYEILNLHDMSICYPYALHIKKLCVRARIQDNFFIVLQQFCNVEEITLSDCRDINTLLIRKESSCVCAFSTLSKLREIKLNGIFINERRYYNSGGPRPNEFFKLLELPYLKKLTIKTSDIDHIDIEELKNSAAQNKVELHISKR